MKAGKRLQRFLSSVTSLLPTSLLFTSLLVMSSLSAAANFTASVNSTTVSEVDIIMLNLRSRDVGVADTPDLTPLEKDFLILDNTRSSRQSISIINGRQINESHVDWNVSLRAKKTGRLMIPPLQLGREISNPIYIQVLPASQAQKQKNRSLVFYESEVSTKKTWVQAQILFTLSLFYSESIAGDVPRLPQINNAVVEVLEDENRFQRVIDGRRYHVLQRKFAIFPQQSGTLVIPQVRFSGYKGASGFFSFSTRERVAAVSQEHRITVQPRPESYPSAPWLPAQTLVLNESWSVNPPVFRVGEPVNRILTLSATGLPSSILPAIPEMEHPNIKVYRDPPETTETPTNNGLVSLRAQVMGIVPTQAGEVVFPAIRIPWWNTDSNQLEVASLPEQRFTIAGSLSPESGVSYQPPVQTPMQLPAETPGGGIIPRGIWFYTSMALASVCLVLIVFLLRMRHRMAQGLMPATSETHSNKENAKQAEAAQYKRLVGACHKGDASRIRHELFLWMSRVSPASQSLDEFIHTVRLPELRKAVNRLDAHLYGGASSGHLDSEALLEAVAAARQRLTQKKRQTREGLTPLNP